MVSMGTNRMADIITGKINLHKGLVGKARKAGDTGAVKAANRRIRQLKADLATERERIARAA